MEHLPKNRELPEIKKIEKKTIEREPTKKSKILKKPTSVIKKEKKVTRLRSPLHPG